MIITITLNTSIDRTLEVQNFRLGNVLKGRCIATLVAGKGVNVSRCLATLGQPSIATGFVGRADARLFEDSFRGTVVQSDFVIVDGTTRRNTTILDPINATETHIRESGFEVTPSDIERLKQKLNNILRPDCHVVFAGSLPLGVSSDEFQYLLQTCIERDCNVSVDTGGEGLKTLWSFNEARKFFAIKPNATELAEIVDDKSLIGENGDSTPGLNTEGTSPNIQAIIVAAHSLLDRVRIALVTLGKEGALCVEEESAWHGQIAIPQERVVNTVGCGDAFLAGFLAGVEEKKECVESLRLALACGASCALLPTAGTIDAAIVKDLMEQAVIEIFGLTCSG